MAKRGRREFEADLQSQQSPYALYGTPLPPLDSQVRDDGSYVPIWQQEVRDERGRKRLHGAFTGGFSAGYFNTVGSKEGWTPSAFVSSRTNRHKDRKDAVQQRPEDFMDEEDLAEQAASQRLHTAGAFAGLGTADEDGRRDVFTGLARAGGETMGAKLLQKMGWRQGQGVGPKVRRKARLDEGDDEDGAAHLFAPENSPMISFSRKSDRKGLGCTGEARLERLSGVPKAPDDDGDEDSGFVPSTKPQTKARKTPRRGGFGVGILNDTGSDEEDVYETGPRISYSRVIKPEKKLKKLGTVTASSTAGNPRVGIRPVFRPKAARLKSSSASVRKCHDGRLPLDGFALPTPSSSLSEGPKYPPARIPDGWTSSKTPEAARTATTTYQSTADAARASALDPKSRAALLGETQLPGKSVFDFLSPAARAKLVAASGRQDLPPALNEPSPHQKPEAERRRDLWDLVPPLDKDLAAGALARGVGGWMPYAEDGAKRARYRAFLELRAGLRNDLPARAPDVSKDDWAQELREFAHAAQVFRPMTGMMASRFTSASAPQSSENDPSAPLLKKPEKKEDPAEEAARLGMFGPLTRSVHQFLPTRLLCKRFDVQPPSHVPTDPGKDSGSQEGAWTGRPSLELVSKDSISEMLAEASLRPRAHGESGNATPLFLKQDAAVDVERNEALEAERAGEAVFKAIFGSEDEDEDDE